MVKNLKLIIVGWLMFALPCWVRGQTVAETTQQTLITAVTAAFKLDAYHAHCRGEVSGRYKDNLNKLLVSKLHITILSVQDDFFPEHDFRAAQQNLEENFLAMLRNVGGCAAAKTSGLALNLRNDYEARITALQALP